MVNSIAFNSRHGGAYRVGDAVTTTVTFSAPVTVDTTGGTPQLTINAGGTDKVLNYSSASPSTALVFTGHTVAANHEDPDGISIAANQLSDNSATIKATADASLDAVLTHAAVAASANHKVDGVKPTLVTTGSNAPMTSLDGSKIILTFSEPIGTVDRTKITVKRGTTTQTTTADSKSAANVEITLTTTLLGTCSRGSSGATQCGRGARCGRGERRFKRQNSLCAEELAERLQSDSLRGESTGTRCDDVDKRR